MDFNLSEEQEILKRSARDFLKQESPMKLVRDIVYNEKGYSPQLWQKMAALGWQGFILPSEYGGEDGSFLDVVVLLEEMGYASSTERDGKKIYTITEEGNQFLVEQRDSADEVMNHMRHHWNPKNIGPVGEVMVEIAKLGRSVGPRIRNAKPKQLQRISEIISRTHQEIEDVLKE